MQLQQTLPAKTPALQKLVVWEAFDVTDPVTLAASHLYEKTLAADERIPWMWIEQSVQDRTKSKPRLRNGCTLQLPPDRTVSPYFQNRIRLCRTMSYESLDSRL